MMDECDAAQLITDRYLTGELSRVAACMSPRGESRRFCEECGGRIPEARRQAVPGCTMCVACQTGHEQRGD